MADRNGSYYIQKNPKLFEPARNNTFRFFVEGLNGILRAGYNEKDNNSHIGDNAEELLELSIAKVDVPSFQQDIIPYRRGNMVIKAAGVPTYNDISIVVNDFVGADGKSTLLAWQNLSFREKENHAVGYMSDYKKDAWLLEYDVNFKLIRQWHIYGCWINQVQQPEYNNEEDGKRSLTANIVYDYYEPGMADEE